jgi:indole-3-glycerol phosphate synthase
VVELAKVYEQNGAAALSVHTDAHFLGRLEDIAAVKAATSLPVLRKEFIVDEYQIYETALAGADGVLLIAAVLQAEELKRYQEIAEDLGLDCLVEVHGPDELPAALAAQAPLLGINNRDLTTFRTEVEHTFQLLPQCTGRLVISESGIKNGEDARRLRQAGVRGILVGEGLVVADDVAAMTREMALEE